MTTIYDFAVETIAGKEVSLKDYQGKVVLIVNTASKCGFTPQFEGLEALYQTYQKQGLVILGFPCNQFLRQDPGSNEEILSFCQLNYGVSFPMFAKIDVKGKQQHPLYQYLVAETGGKKIGWNFTKFLIDQQGNLIERFESKVKPEALVAPIEKLITNQ
ncbi:glutathione peroxidase [Isobaculum melis]|uniref:Glutathione peroxidase n=1 Tax=Isobaculum melis TaxID=142588 RepID=A0A1H9QFS4_9LACT|nr:glutathione peroxidase [Isobaculum melis]SER59324.1 glutathione peroxidase [Isobaculum melis]